MNDAHDNAQTDKDKLHYIQVNHLDKPINNAECHFCGSMLKYDISDMSYTEEVGEFWSKTLQQSVLAHPDCLPLGINATQDGTDPEWSMA